MISIIIPTYRNPKYLDICLQSAIEQADSVNEIIVAVDGFIEESQAVLDKYSSHISVLNLGQNQGMQMALNLGVMNASNETIFIVNDDNVFCSGFDTVIKDLLGPKHVLTLNQIEPTGPGMFHFPVKDFGRNPEEFKYEEFIEFEKTLKEDKITLDGGIFPFAMSKKDYMIVGGFDTMYKSPFICDWDFFLKLDLNILELIKLIYIILEVLLLKMVMKEINLKLQNIQQKVYLNINGVFHLHYSQIIHITPKMGQKLKV